MLNLVLSIINSATNEQNCEYIFSETTNDSQIEKFGLLPEGLSPPQTISTESQYEPTSKRPFPTTLSILYNKNIIQIKQYGQMRISQLCQSLLNDSLEITELNYPVSIEKFDIAPFFKNEKYLKIIHPNFETRSKHAKKVQKQIKNLTSIQRQITDLEFLQNQLSFDMLTADSKSNDDKQLVKLRIEEEKAKVLTDEALKKFFEFEHPHLVTMADPAYGRRKILQLLQFDLLDLACSEKLIGGNSALNYASDQMVRLYKMISDYNDQYLACHGIRYNLGDGIEKEVPLSELAKSASAQISEQYCKAIGLESLAREQGYSWMFITITCPPEFHPNPKRGKNSWAKYDLMDAQKFLTQHYAAFVRDLSREGIKLSDGDIFGLKIIEPHADGCPHWHLLMFYPPAKQNSILMLLDRHLRFSQNSLNIQHQSEEKNQTKRASSPVHYCLKYMMKTFGSLSDVAFVDDDEDDEEYTFKTARLKPSENTLLRVAAWKKAMRIRSIAFFGIKAQSGLWDALRKLCVQNGCIENLENGVKTLNAEILGKLLQQDQSEQQLNLDLNTSDFVVQRSDIKIDVNDISFGEETRIAIEIARSAVENDFHTFLLKANSQAVRLLKETYKTTKGKMARRIIGIVVGTKQFRFNRHHVISIRVQDEIDASTINIKSVKNQNKIKTPKTLQRERAFRIKENTILKT